MKFQFQGPSDIIFRISFISILWKKKKNLNFFNDTLKVIVFRIFKKNKIKPPRSERKRAKIIKKVCCFISSKLFGKVVCAMRTNEKSIKKIGFFSQKRNSRPRVYYSLLISLSSISRRFNFGDENFLVSTVFLFPLIMLGASNTFHSGEFHEFGYF